MTRLFPGASARPLLLGLVLGAAGLAPAAPADDAARARKAQEVTAHIKSLIGVTCAVAVKSPGEVPRSEGKAVRVRDLRKG